jgi:hypothetical protein
MPERFCFISPAYVNLLVTWGPNPYVPSPFYGLVSVVLSYINKEVHWKYQSVTFSLLSLSYVHILPVLRFLQLPVGRPGAVVLVIWPDSNTSRAAVTSQVMCAIHADIDDSIVYLLAATDVLSPTAELPLLMALRMWCVCTLFCVVDICSPRTITRT